MKRAAVILLLIIPVIAFAQGPQGMSEEELQKMMKQMEQMQECMQNVDQGKLKELELRSNKMEAEIKSLCAGGKRDKAQKKAIAFGRDMSADPTLKAFKKCGDMMSRAMPRMSFMNEDQDYSSRHVCDE